MQAQSDCNVKKMCRPWSWAEPGDAQRRQERCSGFVYYTAYLFMLELILADPQLLPLLQAQLR